MTIDIIPDDVKVRYIKFGIGSAYAKHCIDNNTSILGFWSGRDEIIHSCIAHDWISVEKFLLKKRTEQKGAAPLSVTDDLRQVKDFFIDTDEPTLWITFHDGFLYWAMGGLSDFSTVTIDHDLRCEKKMKTNWSHNDLKGRPLLVDDLDKHLSKVRFYNGTICQVERPEYLLNLIKG